MKVREKAVQRIARRTSLATAIGAALGGQVAYAQVIPLESITVTATKRSEDVQKVPISITVLSGDNLQDRGITDVLDLAKAVPGLTVRNSGNDPVPILRGAGIAGTTDTAVPYYVDGIYRPRSGQGLASFLDLERVEVLKGPQGTLFGRNTYGGLINLTTRKPTVKDFDYGAALTLGNYYDRRLEGFVNVPLGDQLALRVTGSGEKRDPYVENIFNPAAGLKDADNRYGRAQLLWKPTGTFSANLGLTYWRDTANGNADFAYKCLGIPVNATTQKLDGVTGFIDPRCGTRDGWEGGRPQAGNVSKGDVSAIAIQDPYKIAFDYKPQRDIREDSVTLRIDWEVLNHNLTINAAKFKYYELRLTDSDLSQKAGLVAGNVVNSRATTVDVTLNSKADGPLRYTLGAYLYDDSKPSGSNGAFLFGYTYTSPQKPTWATFLYQGNGGTKSTALYGQATYSLTDKLSATGGVRYSKDKRESFTLPNIRSSLNDPLPSYGGNPTHSNGSDTHLDSRLSVQYQIDARTMAYAYRATGYISGSVQALTNKLLDPNEAVTYEAGIKTTQLDGRLRLNAALFRTDYTGLTTTIFVTAGAAQTIIAQQVPGGSTRTTGLELDGEYAATNNLRLTFGMAADTSKFNHFNVSNTLGTAGSDFITPSGSGFFIMDGKKTAFSPALTANLGANYTIRLDNASTLVPAAYVSYSSSYRAINQPFFWATQPSYVTLDLAGTWRSADGRYDVKAFVNNATDKAILTQATVFSRGRAMADYNAPRTFGVRLAYNF